MAFRFLCSSCGQDVTTRFLKVGEPYKCTCGAVTNVPESAEVVLELVQPVPPPLPAQAPSGIGPSESTIDAKPLTGGVGVFTLIAFVANGAFMFFQLIGLSMTGTTVLNVIWTLIIFGICGLSILALTKQGESWKGGAIALNIIFFIVIGTLNIIIGKNSEARIGGIMWVFAGLLNVAAFQLRDKLGFLGLYLERKRLEEEKRIVELNKELGRDKSDQ